jgi:hypothetical protein
MALHNFVLYNNAISGMMAGVQSGKLKLTNSSTGEEVEPSDFSDIAAAAVIFAGEVDAILQTVSSPPANIALLVSGGATVVPATAAGANAAESLPAAMCAICKAAWEGRGLPLESSGVSFAAADYQPVANAVVALFVEFASNTSNV